MNPATDAACRLRVTLLRLACAVICLTPLRAAAEETIFDPENPEMEAEGEEDSAGGGDDESGAEVIADPENPDNPDESGESTGDGESEEENQTDQTSAQAGDFRAGYATGVGVDTSWDENGEDIVEWTGRVDMTLDQPLSTHWSAVAAGEIRHWMAGKENLDEPDYLFNATRGRAEADLKLGESYVLFEGDRWTFRTGALVTSWGSTDLIRPGDIISPADFTEFSDPAAAGDLLLPQAAIETSYVQPSWTLTATVVPFFRPNRLALFGRDTALATDRNPLIQNQFPIVGMVEQLFDESLYEDVQPLLLATERPDELPQNASAGLRFTGTRWNTDFGLGYFFGWDRTPFVEIDEDLRELSRIVVEDGKVLEDFDFQGFIGRNPEALELMNDLSDKQREGEQLFSSDYRRLHTVVFDIARYLGPIGFRADVALHPERTFVTESFRSVRRPTVFAAAGTSYEKLFDGRPFTITAEAFWLRPFDVDNPVSEFFGEQSELGPDAGPILLFEDGFWGAAGAIDWESPFWDLGLRVGTVVELDTGGFVLNAGLSKSWTSWFETEIGGTVYEGPDPEDKLSLGGLYDNNDRLDLRISGRF